MPRFIERCFSMTKALGESQNFRRPIRQHLRKEMNGKLCILSMEEVVTFFCGVLLLTHQSRGKERATFSGQRSTYICVCCQSQTTYLHVYDCHRFMLMMGGGPRKRPQIGCCTKTRRRISGRGGSGCCDGHAQCNDPLQHVFRRSGFDYVRFEVRFDGKFEAIPFGSERVVLGHFILDTKHLHGFGVGRQRR